MSVSAIVVAAGRGERLGSPVPKQFLDLGQGRTMLDYSVAVFLASAEIDEIVLALPAGGVDADGRPVVAVQGIQAPTRCPVTVVEGGERRQDSVARALARVNPAAEIVVVHDAARPFVSADLVSRTVRAARAHGAALAAIPVTDTVKQVRVGDSRDVRLVTGTIARDSVFLAQTPQAFRREVLEHAVQAAGDLPATDEATLVERAGYPVHIVEGDPRNIKVTTTQDLEDARARIAAAGSGRTVFRIGSGYDLHRLAEGRPLILAGVRIPFERGLVGHSDADLVCHAVTDAVLGAAAAGDIGQLFPDTDAQWKDANSLALLGHAVERVRAAGFEIGNVDVTVVAERPKLQPHVAAMRRTLAAALGVDVAVVSIKAKTNEQVDATGRGEAMACHAVALLVRS